MKFIDSHSHIQFKPDFPDVDEVINRANEAGVNKQMLVCCTPEDFAPGIEFVKDKGESQFGICIGVHPHESLKFDDVVERKMRELIRNNGCIKAIGEIGLDYFRNTVPLDLQKEVFRKQIRIAKEFDIPIVAHVRDAWDDAYKLVIEENVKKIVFHTFSGSQKLADKCYEKGFFTSFSGVLTYPKNEELRKIVAMAPLDKLLIETDCPYLPPQPYRGKRNEPAFVVEVAREMANIKGFELAKMGEITSENAEKFFSF